MKLKYLYSEERRMLWLVFLIDTEVDGVFRTLFAETARLEAEDSGVGVCYKRMYCSKLSSSLE